MTQPRKGPAPDLLPRDEFARRFRRSTYVPAYGAEKDALDRLEEIAWGAYKAERPRPK